MLKKKIIIWGAISILLSSFAMTPALASEEVSTEETTNVVEEEYTEEPETAVNFAGMLIEVGSTDLPTTLIIRSNEDSVDYTVNLDENVILGQRRDQYTKLEDWIPGDQIRVMGMKNENTGVIEATVASNLSIAVSSHKGLNGWITSIDEENSSVTVQWKDKDYTVRITENTHMVAGLKNPAELSDLQEGDRVRGRLLWRAGEEDPEAKILIVLRRGENLFMKIRTWVVRGQLLEVTGTEAPTTIKIELLPSPLVKEGDVNNLIGNVGDEVEVNVLEETKLVRRFFGSTTLEEFQPGDELKIVGRINDEGMVDAKLIKDNSIWKTSTKGVAGKVTAIDSSNMSFTISWYGKDYIVYVTDSTRIVDGPYGDVAFEELEVDDKIRGRGTRRAKTNEVTAETIVIVPVLE